MNCQKSGKSVIVTAHRGASGLAPENTLAAFKKAIEFQADFSELDVHLSKDGKVILMHDETVDRTTNGSGVVWELDAKELKALDAGSWFSADFTGEPVPDLQEVIHLVKGKMKLNIEIKISGNEPNIAEKVVEIIRNNEFENDCFITSFDKEAVLRVKEIAPDLKTGLIFGTYSDDVFNGNWEILSVNHNLVNKEFMEKAAEKNLVVHTWTVNEKDRMQQMIDLGVDGIITNFPNKLKELLAEKN